MNGITPEKRFLSMTSLVSLIEFDRLKLEEAHFLFTVYFTIKQIDHIGRIVEKEKMYSFKRESMRCNVLSRESG